MLILSCYSEATVTQQKCKLGLKGSGSTMKGLSNTIKRQMLLKLMVKDPMGKQEPHMIKEEITHDEGVHITWYKFTDFMILELF